MLVQALCIAGVTGLLRASTDPFCHEGIVNTEMTACCQKDCGECHDKSPICKASDPSVPNPNGRGSTCCPTQMLDDAKLPSCRNSRAPCSVPDEVRNPPKAAKPERHASQDCNKAIPATKAAQHVATAYIKFEGKNTGATTKDCDKYGDLGQASAACSGDDECLGFTATQGDAKTDPKPKCVLVAGTKIEELTAGGDDTYLKREERDGSLFHLEVTSDYGLCAEDAEEVTRSIDCKSASGVTVKMALCSSLVGMNADAMPASKTSCTAVPEVVPEKDEAGKPRLQFILGPGHSCLRDNSRGGAFPYGSDKTNPSGYQIFEDEPFSDVGNAMSADGADCRAKCEANKEVNMCHWDSELTWCIGFNIKYKPTFCYKEPAAATWWTGTVAEEEVTFAG